MKAEQNKNEEILNKLESLNSNQELGSELAEYIKVVPRIFQKKEETSEENILKSSPKKGNKEQPKFRKMEEKEKMLDKYDLQVFELQGEVNKLM